MFLLRSLHTRIDKIRADYQNDWTAKEMRLRQRGVALYFIDKLALRAGNEKDSDEAADTVKLKLVSEERHLLNSFLNIFDLI